mgnify:FL=1
MLPNKASVLVIPSVPPPKAATPLLSTPTPLASKPTPCNPGIELTTSEAVSYIESAVLVISPFVPP